MASCASIQPLPEFPACLVPGARTWLDDARSRLAEDPARILPELFPALPRRLGRQPFATGIHTVPGTDARIDRRVWRRCDAGALLLLQTAAPTDAQLVDLYYHGDLEEKTMVLRAMTCLPMQAATVTLLGEAQRTNTVDHFEAAACDSNLLARAEGTPGFGRDEFNRAVLKLAFLDLPLARLLDCTDKIDAELARMVQDLATEREAAGRRVWRDTNRLIAHAPTAGTLARLAGGLEHGDDGQRLAAADALRLLRDDFLLARARERLAREPVAAIRAALQQALDAG